MDVSKASVLLAEAERGGELQDIAESIAEAVQAGKGFLDAFGNRRDFFSEYEFSMIQIGEDSGQLDVVFEILAQEKSETRNDLALWYRRLSTMLQNGFSLFQALEVSFVGLNAELKDRLETVRDQVLNGATMPSAADSQRSIFPEPVVVLFRLSEEIGTLDHAIHRLAWAYEASLIGFPQRNEIDDAVKEFSALLWFLIEAGSTVAEAIRVLSESAARSDFRECLESIISQLPNLELAEAMKQFPHFFSESYCAIIWEWLVPNRSLDRTLRHLAEGLAEGLFLPKSKQESE